MIVDLNHGKDTTPADSGWIEFRYVGAVLEPFAANASSAEFDERILQ